LVEKHLGEELDETSLGYLALRLGWLNRVGRDKRGDSIFAFYHATFQEYFAALAVEDWDYFLPKDHCDRPVAGKRYRIFEPQWKQVILLWLGREDVVEEKKEGFIRAFVEFEDGSMGLYWFHAVFLAAAEIGEFKTCSQVDVVNAIVKQIVKWGLGYYNQEKQEWWGYFNQIQKDARETIFQTDRKRDVQELYQMLEHPQCHEYPRRLAVYT
jgi:predicted NACHT family NTPase